jgi:hypothetical protein
MGHQVNFYITNKDTASLEATLRQLGSLCILHDRSLTAMPRVVDSLDVHEGDQPWLYLYLARCEHLPEVRTKHVPTQGYWAIDMIQSPAIEFTRSFFDGHILRRGRAYYVDGFYRPDGAWIEKSDSFKGWARSVLNTFKKSLRRKGSDYIGHDALSWLSSSGGKLIA